MTSPVDIGNRALSEIGTRSTIASFAEGSEESIAIAMWYDPLRRQLLRAAPWGFAREQGPLALLGSSTDIPPAAPYPWLYKYTYPASALVVRYLLPPPPSDTTVVPIGALGNQSWAPSRANRFIIASDKDAGGHTRKVVLSNLQSASAVYVRDEENVDLFDVGFEQALVSAIAAKVCIALTGNKDMRQAFIASADAAIIQARLGDGNQAISSTDHTPDWIAARGLWEPAYAGAEYGMWMAGWSDMNWGQ